MTEGTRDQKSLEFRSRIPGVGAPSTSRLWRAISRLWPLLVFCTGALSACAPAEVRHNEAGNTRFSEGAYEDAIAEYGLAQVAEPDLAEPYYNAANAHNRLSQIDAAMAQAEQALKTANPALAAQTWYNLGNAFFDAEQWLQAVEAYKEALRLQPDDTDAKNNLELALHKLEEQQQQNEQQQENDQPSNGEQEQPEQNEQAGATPTPEGEPASSTDQGEEDSATPQPSGEPQEQQPLTEEQAIQLLRALLSDSQTLQERLQRIHQVPGSEPEQDW